MSRIRTILHPSDFSRASTPAFTQAVAMAKSNRARLLVVHVLLPSAPMLMADGYVAPQVYEELDTAARADAQKRLGKLVEQAKRAGVRATALLLKGVAPERIVQAARARKADLVVIGTHGRTGLARLFLGSVASRVLAMSRCPVLTVRGR
ncbi:MAG TPA: universal stress protein [Methylomirabilota bacterium]|jgi:nucleotide-binding universal stress UspA family protein